MATMTIKIEVKNADPSLQDPEELAAQMIPPDVEYMSVSVISAEWED